MKPLSRKKARTPPIAEAVTHHDDEHSGSEHDEATTTTAVGRTGTAQYVLPVSRSGRGGKDPIEAGAVEIDHVRTSSSRVRSVVCAALRVEATVPVEIPSASPIVA